VIECGNLTKELPSLNEIREYFISRFEEFPQGVKDIHKKWEYPVNISQKLVSLYEKLRRKLLTGG
jgi:nicotinate phosphoribosyltransferase